jgi:hypothetical protein
MRPVAVVEGVKPAGDAVLTISLRAHGPSSRVRVHPLQDPVLWEDLLGHTVGVGDALDGDAAVVAGNSLQQEEDRALVLAGLMTKED